MTATMAKTVTPSVAITGEKMAPPSITLRPEKRSPTNSQSSPSRTRKTTPMNTEKKPQINGHESPSHASQNITNNHAVVEGYMKTDDRMRLAKERREEREKSLAAREQLIREKERRARLQYERTVEERCRRLEEQRQKEELRRAAVEEKRRQQLEEERERLEALMRRSMERSLQLEQRNKRWSRLCPTGAGESENAPIPFSAVSTFPHGIASPLPAVSESAPCSPHRSPFRSSLNPADRNRAGLHQGGSQSTPNTPKKERLKRERRTASPGCRSPLRRTESPASVTKQLASTSKLASNVRSQSPSNAHYSPTRHPKHSVIQTSSDRKAEDKNVERQTKPQNTEKKNTDNNVTHPSSQAEVTKNGSCNSQTFDKQLKSNTSEHETTPHRKNHMSPKVDPSEKKIQCNAQNGEKKKEPAPCTSTVKTAGGTTNAEEATKLLTERRRQARAQKELEEKKWELEEEGRLWETQQRKQPAREQQQEAKVQEVMDKEKSEEDHRLDQEDKDEKEQQTQMEGEREKVKFQARKGAERQREDRELQAQQEEEERQLRKKRIEEIMKRTRKGEGDVKREEQVGVKPVSLPGEQITVQTNSQVNEQAKQKLEFQVKEPFIVQANMKECSVMKEAAARADDQKSSPVHSVPDKRMDTRQTGEELIREAKADVLKQQGREMNKAGIKVKDQLSKEPQKLAAEDKAEQKGNVLNGATKGNDSVFKSRHTAAERGKQQSMPESAAAQRAKGESQAEVVRPSVTSLPVGNLAPPIIKLEDMKDEVQSMEVSPAPKEQLISIPEFSPVEFQQSTVSNSRALEELMDLTGSLTYSKLSPEGNIGDCNKNLIGGVISPMSDSKLIGMSPPSANHLSIK